jgi:hypothetical protein
MLDAFFKDGGKTRHFTGAFQAPAGNFYNSEEVEIDIVRGGEQIAVAVTDLISGHRFNSDDAWTNKVFKAPVLKEAYALNVFDLLKRQPGMSAYESPDFQAAATAKSLRMGRKLADKIARTIELQAAQILTTGVVTLVDSAGVTVYTVDYAMKNTHKPNAGVTWTTTATADPTSDLSLLADVIRADGLTQPDIIEFGAGAFEAAMKVTTFRDRFDLRRADLGTLVPMQDVGEGGKYRGTLELGNYKFDCYTYSGWYAHPQTGTKTAYLPDTKVIMRTSGARLDATFGAVPRIVPPDSRVLPYLPPRISSSAERIDLWPNAWVTADGEQLIGAIASRPLLIPTDIYSFGCLTTTAA